MSAAVEVKENNVREVERTETVPIVIHHHRNRPRSQSVNTDERPLAQLALSTFRPAPAGGSRGPSPTPKWVRPAEQSASVLDGSLANGTAQFPTKDVLLQQWSQPIGRNANGTGSRINGTMDDARPLRHWRPAVPSRPPSHPPPPPPPQVPAMYKSDTVLWSPRSQEARDNTLPQTPAVAVTENFMPFEARKQDPKSPQLSRSTSLPVGLREPSMELGPVMECPEPPRSVLSPPPPPLLSPAGRDRGLFSHPPDRGLFSPPPLLSPNSSPSSLSISSISGDEENFRRPRKRPSRRRPHSAVFGVSPTSSPTALRTDQAVTSPVPSATRIKSSSLPRQGMSSTAMMAAAPIGSWQPTPLSAAGPMSRSTDAIIMSRSEASQSGYTCITVTKQGIHWEQPIFTTKAHVFQIDPSTKKKWLPASTQAINVSYYFDSTRNSYRIISVEGSKAVINSTILPTMQFTKTSQKFGQWTDPRANTVYGLGFASEVELAKFIDKFKEVKELTRQASQKAATTNGTNDSNHAPASPDTTTSNSPINKPTTISNSPVADAVINERRNSGSTPISTSSPGNAESHLKYENDRLKIALAQSSANAKKWEIELQTLKNNNARLTTALQESTANVEEWKKQLAMYKEESARMKKRVIEMEKGGGGDSTLAQAQVAELNTKISQMEIGAQSKDNELAELKRQVEQLRPLESHNKQLTDRAQHFENENKRLQSQVTDLQSQLEQARQGQQREKQQIRGLHDQLRNKISELYTLQDQVTSMLAS